MLTIVCGRRWGVQTRPIPNKEKPPFRQGHGRCLSHVRGRQWQRQSRLRASVSAAASSALKESLQCRCVCSPEPAAGTPAALQPCSAAPHPCSPAVQHCSPARAGRAVCPCPAARILLQPAPRSRPLRILLSSGWMLSRRGERSSSCVKLFKHIRLGFLGQALGSLCRWGGQCGGCTSSSSQFQACSSSVCLELKSLPICSPGYPCLFLLPSLLTSPCSHCRIPTALLPFPCFHSPVSTSLFPPLHSHCPIPTALFPLPCSHSPVPIPLSPLPRYPCLAPTAPFPV